MLFPILLSLPNAPFRLEKKRILENIEELELEHEMLERQALHFAHHHRKKWDLTRHYFGSRSEALSLICECPVYLKCSIQWPAGTFPQA